MHWLKPQKSFYHFQCLKPIKSLAPCSNTTPEIVARNYIADNH